MPLYGHGALRRRLRETVERGSLPSSLLLQGPRGVGKQRLALWLGQLLLCESVGMRPCGACQHCRYSGQFAHPDLHWFFPRPRLSDGDVSHADVREDLGDAAAERLALNGLYPAPGGDESIFVASVRALVHAAAISPALARRKVFVVGDAERMVPQTGKEEAANAFLKLLEEPPRDTTLILTSSEPGALLATIRSRVVSVRVGTLTDAEVRSFASDPLAAERLAEESGERDVEILVRLAQGAPGRLLSGGARSEAVAGARRLLDAATSRRRQDSYRAVFAHGRAKARGSYSDTLDALTVLLHARVRESADSDPQAALGAGRAVAVVEEAKERALGNVNPALLSASLVRQLRDLLA
ncbi:MAG TPA: hypothetical protein VMM18_13710 [Gemmatimonadaceae bacterium]|nr:hypothetical protein [Gemmatimonadaceae bacterium]